MDPLTSTRIVEWEERHQGPSGLEWPVLVALIFGGIALGAGILLLVVSRWESYSPTARFALVIGMVVILHLGAIIASDSPRFRSAFHVLGNIAFGAAIFLSGEIFHLSSGIAHGITLWTLGTAASWLLLRDAPQTILLAVLAPVAIGAEYTHFYMGVHWSGEWGAVWGTMMAFNYLSAVYPHHENGDRVALMWVGAIGLVPAALLAAVSFGDKPPALHVFLAGALAMAIAWILRREQSWINALFILWVIAVGVFHENAKHQTAILVYPLYALAAGGLVWWGLRESRPERINFGIAGFALTVLFFYLSSVFDRVGRSESLIGLGILLLAGGWFLERTRRGLIAGMKRIE